MNITLFKISGLVAAIFALLITACTSSRNTDHQADSGKVPLTSQRNLNRKANAKKQVAPRMDLWPASWLEHHQRFNDYLETRKKTWPHPVITFHEPDQLRWNALPETRSAYNITTTDGIQYFLRGRHRLSRGDEGLAIIPPVFAPGIYTASVWRFVRGYQHMSAPFHFEVSFDNNQADRKPEMKIVLYHPKSDSDLFPNQWWYYNADFHLWDTSARVAIKFFETLRPFEPNIVMEKADGPSVKRNLLDPKLERLLELRIYHQGKLKKTVAANGVGNWSFDFGPGHYVFLIVAPDDDGGALIVSRPFQIWFPDEGDGVLRYVPLDTDKDGIPDYWERSHGLNPQDPEDAMRLYFKKPDVTFLDVYENEKRYNRIRQ